MMASRRSASRRQFLGARRNALMLGCALSAASFVLADQARAQAFQATPTTQAGSVTYNRLNPSGPGTETITVNSNSAIVNWTFGTPPPGPIIFLPAGNVATFTNGANANFVVLNRMINAGGNPIRFDGTVISQLQSGTGTVPGGTVLFSNPGGIIVGSMAVFDVGSLVLTSLDVIDASGVFITPGGGFQFRNGGGRGEVVTEGGAQINATSEGSNIAFVAPTITHAGALRVNGSVGYIAAQSVDVAFNNGLFDIIVQTAGGTSIGGTVITHIGSTGGPASTGAGDNHRIYMAGVAETNAISMLLGGAIGFDAAVSATVENGQIVLSAGYDVDNGVVFETINNGAPASTIGSFGGNFTSDVVARARSGIVFSAFTSDLVMTGDFDALSRGAVVGLLATNNFDINVGGNVTLATTQLVRTTANPDSIGGTAAIQANTGSAITIGGNVALDSSALGIGLLDGSFVGRGGTVRVTGNGAVSITGNLSMNAIGQGRDGGFGGVSTIEGSNTVSVGGNLGSNVGGTASVNTVGITGGLGQGGTINLDTSGSILIGGGATLATAGVGGNVSAPTSSTGGDGTGGTINIISNGGTIDIGGATGMSFGATGGSAESGGDATGGTLNVEVRGGTVDLGTGVLIVGNATGGTGTAGGGTAQGGQVNMALYSGATAAALRSGLIAANIDGSGGNADPTGGIGGNGTGGNFDLLIDSGNASATIGGISASANGAGGDALGGGDAQGGRVLIEQNGLGLGLGTGGASSLGNLDLTATADGGDGLAGGGNGTGGQVRLSADRSPITGAGIAIAFGTAVMDASGTGGDGLRPAGNGIGGSVSLVADGPGASLNGTSVDARANGIGGANPDFLPGGDGLGGTSVGMLATSGGTIALTGTASFSAFGTGGASATGGGGAGTGGNTRIEAVDDGSITIAGGTSAVLSGAGGAGAAGGAGSGGGFFAFVDRTDAPPGALAINLGPSVNVTALGTGGAGNVATGGAGAGGQVLFEIDSGGPSSQLSGGTVTANVSGTGGAGQTDGGLGTGGTVRLAVDSGNAQASFTGITATAIGTGGAGIATAGNGGGGSIALGHENRRADGTGARASLGALDLTARGIGGAGPTGGTGTGGGITVNAFSMFSGTSIPVDFGAAVMDASGTGGDGSAGGAGQGGAVIVQAGRNGVAMAGGSINALAGGTGGNASGAGQAGGAGTGGALTMTVDAAGILQLTGAAAFSAPGLGGNSASGAGGAGTGGIARTLVAGDASATLGGLTLRADGTGGNGASGGAGNAGNSIDNPLVPLIGGVFLDVIGGNVQSGAVTMSARGFGGAGTSGAGGAGTGGTARIVAFRALGLSTINLAAANLDISGAGGNGAAGGNGTGGTNGYVRADAVSGVLGVGGLIFNANATGGAGTTLAGGGALAGAVTIGTWLDGSSAGPFQGSATFASIVAAADARGGASAGTTVNASGGEAIAGTVTLLADTGNVEAGATTLVASAEGGAGGTPGIGGNANGGNVRVAATGAELALTGPAALAADAIAGAGGTAGAAIGGLLEIFTDSDSPTGLPGSIVATSVGGSANASGGANVAGRWDMAAVQGNMSFGSLTLSASGDAAPASRLFVEDGSITVSGLASLSSSGDIDAEASGAGQFTGSGVFALNSGGNITVSHINPPAGTPAFDVGGFSATAAGNVTVDAGAVIQASDTLSIDAAGDVNAAGSLLGGDVDVSGATVTLALVDGVNLDLDAVTGLNVTQATATGDIAFTAGTVANFGNASAGGSFTGSAAALVLPNVTAAVVNVAATAGTATLGDVTGTTSITATATGDLVFNQLTGGEIALTSSAGDVSGTNATGSSAAFNAAGTLAAGTATASGNISFAAGGPANFGIVNAGGSFTGNAATLSLPQVTAQVVNVSATAGQAALGTVTGTTSLTVAAVGNVTFAQLNGGAIALTSSGGSILGSNATGTTLLFDAALNAGFSGLITGNEIRVVSSDIDVGTAARLGNATTQLVQLTARPGTLQTVIGGTAQGPGYTLTNAEAGRIRAAQLAILASAAGTAANRAPDVLMRDLTLSATPTTAGTAVNQLVVTLGGATPAILQVEGAVRLGNAGVNDGISITAPGRLQVVTDTGSVRVLDAGGLPSGEVVLASNNIWSANSDLLGQLLADPNFAGRNDALLNNDGTQAPRGFIEGGEVTLRAGNTIFVQNSGSPSAFAGITVVRDTLNVVPTGTTPLDVFAFGRRINPDGTFLTNSLYFYEVAFTRQGVGFTNDAQFNLCFINSGICPGLFGMLDVPEGREQIEGPIDEADDADGGGAVPVQRTVEDDIIDTSFSSEGLIEEPVTSGADSSLWDCDLDDDGVCDVEGGPTP